MTISAKLMMIYHVRQENGCWGVMCGREASFGYFRLKAMRSSVRSTRRASTRRAWSASNSRMVGSKANSDSALRRRGRPEIAAFVS
jgi:hypothetical protein